MECPGFFGEEEEDRLRNILREVRIANLAQGGGVNEIEMPRNEDGKGFVGMFCSAKAQELLVVAVLHLTKIMAAR